jgi:GntR family transcriptional regulator, transcriptional repressor for pyruvate dehydrogenase complex
MDTNLNKTARQVFTPVRSERLADKVAGQLKKAIISGVFRIGERLPSERELSEQMGVSRPSVRAALHELEVLGMVETVHGGGTIVKNLTDQAVRKAIEAVLEEDPGKILELTEVRAFMEAWAARQAAKNRTTEDLEIIRSHLDEMERDFESGEVRSEPDSRFHAEIAAASHNMVFLHLMHNIIQLVNQSVAVSRERVFVSRDDQKKILNHHRQIYRAIEHGDPRTAEVAMNRHLSFVVREYRNRFLSPSD